MPLLWARFSARRLCSALGRICNARTEEAGDMLSVENNELLTMLGPGTPMGTLMRHYWQPVCAVEDILHSPFRTKAVKILGEELVVYRDRRGHLGVVDKYCAHRRASLAYGVVENDGIRCQY